MFQVEPLEPLPRVLSFALWRAEGKAQGIGFRGGWKAGGLTSEVQASPANTVPPLLNSAGLLAQSMDRMLSGMEQCGVGELFLGVRSPVAC